MFSENFFQTAGEIVGIRFSMSSDGAFRGFAYIEFASVEAANKVFLNVIDAIIFYMVNDCVTTIHKNIYVHLSMVN